MSEKIDFHDQYLKENAARVSRNQEENGRRVNQAALKHLRGLGEDPWPDSLGLYVLQLAEYALDRWGLESGQGMSAVQEELRLALGDLEEEADRDPQAAYHLLGLLDPEQEAYPDRKWDAQKVDQALEESAEYLESLSPEGAGQWLVEMFSLLYPAEVDPSAQQVLPRVSD